MWIWASDICGFCSAEKVFISPSFWKIDKVPVGRFATSAWCALGFGVCSLGSIINLEEILSATISNISSASFLLSFLRPHYTYIIIFCSCPQFRAFSFIIYFTVSLCSFRFGGFYWDAFTLKLLSQSPPIYWEDSPGSLHFCQNFNVLRAFFAQLIFPACSCIGSTSCILIIVICGILGLLIPKLLPQLNLMLMLPCCFQLRYCLLFSICCMCFVTFMVAKCDIWGKQKYLGEIFAFYNGIGM